MDVVHVLRVNTVDLALEIAIRVLEVSSVDRVRARVRPVPLANSVQLALEVAPHVPRGNIRRPRPPHHVIVVPVVSIQAPRGPLSARSARRGKCR